MLQSSCQSLKFILWFGRQFFLFFFSFHVFFVSLDYRFSVIAISNDSSYNSKQPSHCTVSWHFETIMFWRKKQRKQQKSKIGSYKEIDEVEIAGWLAPNIFLDGHNVFLFFFFICSWRQTLGVLFICLLLTFFFSSIFIQFSFFLTCRSWHVRGKLGTFFFHALS